MIRTFAALGIIVVAIDAVDSFMARSSGLPYVWFMLVQIVFYTGLGFVLRRRGFPLRDVLVAAAITSIVDGTLGEWTAVRMGGATAVPLAVAAAAVPIFIVVEIALALTGFALASIGRTARS